MYFPITFNSFGVCYIVAHVFTFESLMYEIIDCRENLNNKLFIVLLYDKLPPKICMNSSF
jgi:hypothetical protein